MSSDVPSSAGHRERLRQRLLTAGGEGFHDYELLEYLLALAIPRQDTKPLAKRLIEEFGSLAALIAATPEDRLFSVSDAQTQRYWKRQSTFNDQSVELRN